VTANTGFVGVRIPNHKVALDLLSEAGVPIAAPSANKFSHISPSKPDHVLSEFPEGIPVIDGGPCEIGVESTVVKIDKNE
jgi:L-threonylcarbamoyladenylate synthase